MQIKKTGKLFNFCIQSIGIIANKDKKTKKFAKTFKLSGLIAITSLDTKRLARWNDSILLQK